MTYFVEFTVISALLGTFVLLLLFPFALAALAIVVLAAAAAVLVVLVAVVAAPILAVRAVLRHWSSRPHAHAEDPAYAVRASVGSAS